MDKYVGSSAVGLHVTVDEAVMGGILEYSRHECVQLFECWCLFCAILFDSVPLFSLTTAFYNAKRMQTCFLE